MKIRILYLIVFSLLVLGSASCASAFDRVRELPEGVPIANYNGRVVQALIPTYYNEKTGCYISSKPSARLNDNSDFTVVNSFTSGENAKVAFLLILKPNTVFMISGDKYFALYHYDEVKEDWEEAAYSTDESAPQWQYGNMLTEDSYWNIGKEKCHFIPESPIILYLQNGEEIIEGKYRLYVWGFSLGTNAFAFTGDSVDFTVKQEE